MSCIDCIHRDICVKRQYIDFAGEDWSKNCKDFLDKSEIIKLPCKVGDTVYEITPRDTISIYEITEIVIQKESIFLKWKLLEGYYSNLEGFSPDKLGKTLFFTREEAEKHLEESNGQNGFDT